MDVSGEELTCCCESWGSSLGRQIRWQVPLLSEPSCPTLMLASFVVSSTVVLLPALVQDAGAELACALSFAIPSFCSCVQFHV